MSIFYLILSCFLPYEYHTAAMEIPHAATVSTLLILLGLVLVSAMVHAKVSIEVSGEDLFFVLRRAKL